MCYVYSSLVSAPRGFWGLAASAPAKSELDIRESFFLKTLLKMMLMASAGRHKHS